MTGEPLPSAFLEAEYVTIPLNSYSGDSAPSFSTSDIDRLISVFGNIVRSSSCTTIANTNTFYWLSHMLACAVGAQDQQQVEKIISMLFTLAENDPITTAAALSTSIEVGKYKGQVPAYIIASKLYTAAFYPDAEATIDNISILLSSLIKNAPNFRATLIKKVTEGTQIQETPILKIIQALIRAGSKQNNAEATRYLMDLLIDCFEGSPQLQNAAAVERITNGFYKNKSIHYFIVMAFDQAIALKDDYTTLALSNILIQIAQTNELDAIEPLTRIINSGTHPFHSLQIIMRRLQSAAFVSDNNQNIQIIMNLLTQMMIANSENFGLALAQSFTVSRFNGSMEFYKESGISALVKALSAAIDHGNDITQILTLLTKLLNNPSSILINAFMQNISVEGAAEETPLMVLQQALRNIGLTDESRQNIQNMTDSIVAFKNTSPLSHSSTNNSSSQSAASITHESSSQLLTTPFSSTLFSSKNPKSVKLHSDDTVERKSPSPNKRYS